MIPWSGCCRFGWRGAGCRLPWDMVVPVIVPPVFVLVMSFCSRDSIPLVATACALVVYSFTALTRFEATPQILYYWIASSVTYLFIVFENVVIPLSEIETEENFILILFSVFALFFLYLTKNVWEQPNRREDSFANGALTETCPICRVKVSPRCYHCRICQICVPKYDYHCYWLNCCIGDSNQHFFVVGIIFGMLALGYAALLILTTVCLPEFLFGILLPKDCTDVSASLGMFASFVSGIYCMELAFFLISQIIHQFYLISRGFSGLEWKQQVHYNIFRTSPYSRGFLGNWVHFFKSFRKIIP